MISLADTLIGDNIAAILSLRAASILRADGKVIDLEGAATILHALATHQAAIIRLLAERRAETIQNRQIVDLWL